jgi:hypothetical protein
MTTHVESAIDKYFAGRIEALEERDALFGHLDRCDGCRRRFDELARTHRAMSSVDGAMPAAELHLIGRTVVAAAARREEPRFSWAFWGRIAAPVLALGAALVFFLRPVEEEFTAKGSVRESKIAIEALCFDLETQSETVLRADGECPAPSFVKLMYASPHPAGHFHVVVRQGTEERLQVTLDRPEPRSPIPGHVQLDPEQTLDVVVVEDGIERPVLSIRGSKP